MVAISLYRGNLHRPADAPRRWLMPTPTISLKRFKSLLHRRSLALSRLRSSSSSSAAAAANPNPNPPPITAAQDNAKVKLEEEEEENVSSGSIRVQLGSSEEDGKVIVKEEVKREEAKGEEVKYFLHRGDATDEILCGPEVDAGVSFQPDGETAEGPEELNEKEKRKKEVEEKLQVLKGKKHNLVQVLKQILNVEEELKRRNTAQGMSMRPFVPLHVDVTNDSTGSMTRHATPRTGADGNAGGEVEGGEAEDASNHNIHSRHLHRMSSLSPSSESPLRRPPFLQYNLVPHPSQSTHGISGSPSRFAPTTHQGHPANLPMVSISGTNYVASSPSPAASGGTSAFKDARQPSPWN